MPPIQIHDFDPAEGDTIELSPSYAIYDGFTGFDVVDGDISLDFTYGTIKEFAPQSFGGGTTLSDNGRCIYTT